MHPGQGPGLSLHDLGETSGTTSVTLLQSEIPAHSHTVFASSYPADTNNAGNGYWGRVAKFYSSPPTPTVAMSPLALATSGGTLPHNNMQPYLTMNFIIALQGVFPPRS